MPIYAYECAKCDEQPEFIQRISEPPKKKCESCGGKLSKLLTTPAFHLKGGGWYKDGYASTKTSSDSSSGSTDDSKRATKSTEKPAKSTTSSSSSSSTSTSSN